MFRQGRIEKPIIFDVDYHLDSDVSVAKKDVLQICQEYWGGKYNVPVLSNIYPKSVATIWGEELKYIHKFSADGFLTQFEEYFKLSANFEFKFIPTNQTREYTAGVLLRGDQLRPRMLNIKTVRDENW